MTEILWAPWRLEYIESESPDTGSKDIFLDLPAENQDEKNLIVYRGKHAFVILNAYPYTNGHLLIAPYRQVAELEQLNDDELLEINQLLAKTSVWLKKCYKPDGFNVGVNLGKAAGAGIPIHIHWHIVPRWAGDTNFTTTVGKVRVMPQSLEDSYRRLKEVASQ
ncbi:MAG: HIT domain-containing protein [Armatimonadetes bacterium]|nr:HIT domain-containing protein [Armatimonadota bacterium]